MRWWRALATPASGEAAMLSVMLAEPPRDAHPVAPWPGVLALFGLPSPPAHDFDPELAPISPTGSPVGDAVEALGTAAASIRRRLGHDRAAWSTIVAFTHGRLLAPRWA